MFRERSRCVHMVHEAKRERTDAEKMIKDGGYSSAGRAPALQAGGQEFDSPYLHQ